MYVWQQCRFNIQKLHVYTVLLQALIIIPECIFQTVCLCLHDVVGVWVNYSTLTLSNYSAQQWRQGLIVSLNMKGDTEDPGNYRGITLLK